MSSEPEIVTRNSAIGGVCLLTVGTFFLAIGLMELIESVPQHVAALFNAPENLERDTSALEPWHTSLLWSGIAHVGLSLVAGIHTFRLFRAWHSALKAGTLAPPRSKQGQTYSWTVPELPLTEREKKGRGHS